MPEIRLLESDVINLIAAGEVVERPSSAVKELVENAIDAGATRITVEIRRGGLGLIRVTDDGCGMTAENAKKAFLKHATSKIRTQEDLYRIDSLGFRGEALAAISAVSKVTLTTKVAGETSGLRLELSEGKILSEEECGCPDGSSFHISDLFFNTPARLKFMKSEPAEAGAVQSVMEKLALSHPEIAFRFLSNGTERFSTHGNGDLAQTVFSLFGREFAEMSLRTDETTDGIRVFGLVGKPIYSKANRTRQIFFLNGRYVRSAILAGGLEGAYQNKMLVGRVPVCVLFVQIDPSLADVNVHPGKLEVKFANESAVAYAVRKATQSALLTDSGIVEMRVPTPPPQAPTVPGPLKTSFSKVDVPKKPTETVKTPDAPVATTVITPVIKRVEPEPKPVTPEKQTEPKKPEAALTPIAEKDGWLISVPLPKIIVKDSAPNLIAENPTQPPVHATDREKPAAEPAAKPEQQPALFRSETPFRFVGEVFDCYVIVEKDDDVLFIDKHALHERMNFERIRKNDVPSQTLLHPIVTHLGAEENRRLSDNADFLSRFGFMIESFGDDLLVREIPAVVDAEQVEPLLQQFADSLVLGKDESLLDRFYYDLACKASIRSGSKSTDAELKLLVAEYFRRESELQYCPHGRPIVFSLSKKSVEKQFKRVK